MRSRTIVPSLVLLTLAICKAPNAQDQVPPEEIWAWQHRDAALEVVFPHPVLKIDITSEGPEWLISVRVSPAWEDPEWQLLVSKEFDGAASVTLNELKGGSVPQQLAALRTKHPDWTEAQDYAAITTTKSVVTSQACDALTSLAEKATDLRVGLVNRNFICIHCARYNFSVDTYYGKPMTFSMSEPNGSYWGQLADHPNKLLEWVQRVKQAVDKCQSKPQS